MHYRSQKRVYMGAYDVQVYVKCPVYWARVHGFAKSKWPRGSVIPAGRKERSILYSTARTSCVKELNVLGLTNCTLRQVESGLFAYRDTVRGISYSRQTKLTFVGRQAGSINRRRILQFQRACFPRRSGLGWVATPGALPRPHRDHPTALCPWHSWSCWRKIWRT